MRIDKISSRNFSSFFQQIVESTSFYTQLTIQDSIYRNRSRLLPTHLPFFSPINSVLKLVGQKNLVLTNVTVEFTANAPVPAHTTVIDNTFDDPIFVLPFAEIATPPN